MTKGTAITITLLALALMLKFVGNHPRQPKAQTDKVQQDTVKVK
jgi:hypothetical protein